MLIERKLTKSYKFNQCCTQTDKPTLSSRLIPLCWWRDSNSHTVRR